MKSNVIWLLAILVILGGFAAWRFLTPRTLEEQSVTPNTAETATNWMCLQCNQLTKLTAREYETWRETPGKLDGKTGRGTVTAFKCDKCQTFTVVRVEYCDKHDLYYARMNLDGTTGDCDKCAREAGLRR